MNSNTILRSINTFWMRAVTVAASVSVVCGLMATASAAEPTFIDHLSSVDEAGKLVAGNVSIGLNQQLAIVLKIDSTTVVDPAKAVLFLDGRAIVGLKDTIYRSNDKALIFRLQRNSENADGWQPLLATPSLTPRSVAVGLWLEKPPAGTSPPLIARADQVQPAFTLILISTGSLIAGIIAVVLMLVVVWARVSNTNILKDSLLPQLAPKEQPFSLGRTQMAFWFTLIFASYVFLYVLLWDYNTLTSQSLILMGLSGATAIFAVAIDASKNTPIGAANETLRTMGLNTYADVLRLDREIEDRQVILQNTPPAATVTIQQLKTEITDRLNKKRSWYDITRPYISTGWYRDLTTDVNGPALHRVQVFVWTLALGVIFLIDIYRTLTMPQFSDLQLALLGVTSAGYLGFKFPEKQQ
jgi:hypothetical protein